MRRGLERGNKEGEEDRGKGGCGVGREGVGAREGEVEGGRRAEEGAGGRREKGGGDGREGEGVLC